MKQTREALHGRSQGWMRKLGVAMTGSFCFVMLIAPRASAQVDEGAIAGTVTDSTGAAVPNAAVTLVNTDVGLTPQATTNEAGEYTFQPIRIGHYQVSVTASGFAKTTQ